VNNKLKKIIGKIYCPNFFAWGNLIVVFITAVVLLGTLYFIHKQFKELSAQSKVLQAQISFTKYLKRPICAVKKIELSQPSVNEYFISVIFINSGEYIAKNVSIEWECLTANIERVGSKVKFNTFQ
jgi:hypothetical protein